MSIIYEALKRIEGRPAYRQKRRINGKKVILPFLIAIAAIILLYSSTNMPSMQKLSTKAAASPKQTPLAKKQPVNIPYPSLTGRPQAFTLRDPFSKTKDFTLSGIIYSPDKPVAIVNSKTVSIGEIVGEAKVSNINEESVELSLNNEKIILTLE